MLTLPFQILTQICLNENEADVDTDIVTFPRGRKYDPCLKFLKQITVENENELAEMREVFPKN